MPIASAPTVLLIGLGAVGRSVASELVRSPRCEVIGAVDLAPSLLGEPLASVVPGADEGARVHGSIAEAPRADIAFVATTSFIADVEPIIMELLDAGMNVVSIAEELGFGFFDHAPIATRIDERARERGLTVLGTGCNPGILADTLPLLLSSLTLDVSAVRMHRTADMGGYGGILSKFGFGLTEPEFHQRVAAGSVIGHVGFRESVAALAAGLGWTLDEIVTEAPSPIFVAPAARRAAHIELQAGTVAAVRHSVSGRIGGVSVIEAVIDFGIFDASDPFAPGDEWTIESAFQPLEFRSSRINSHISTVAVAANALPEVVGARAGLLTMAELPVVSLAAKSRAVA